VLKSGTERPSARGDTKFLPNVLLVVSSPEPLLSDFAPHTSLSAERPNEKWVMLSEGGKETYRERMEKPINQMDAGAELIKKYPYSRRVSFSIARPWDVKSGTSPSLMEVYVQVTRGETPQAHVTGFFRSVDVYNYLNLNLIGLAEIQQRICSGTGLGAGTIAAMLVNAHYYRRDEKKVEKVSDANVKPSSDSRHAKLIEAEHIPFGWFQTLEHIYHEGFEDETQWGEVFEKQGRAKFAHRLLVDISEPLEDMLDDKAPFTKEYGEEYASRYVIGTPKLPAGRGDVTLESGEVYTYASRARWDKNDIERFKKEPTDQLYFAIKMLKEDRYTRRAAVNISRPWDVTLKEPACLRAYVFQALDKDTLGATFFMRSNDAYGATAANQYAFARLVQFAAMQSGFSKVRLTLLSVNMHIYGDSWNAVDGMLNPKMPSARERFGI
jgi:thymidylate synthase